MLEHLNRKQRAVVWVVGLWVSAACRHLQSTLLGGTTLARDDAEAHYKLGVAAQLRGDSIAAIAEFRETLRLQPGNVKALVFLGIMHEGKHIAITECRNVLDSDPDNNAVRGVLVDLLQEKGDLNGTIAECQEWLRLEPKSALGHKFFAGLLVKKGDPEGAMAEYRKALRLKSGDVWAHYELGRLLETEHDLDAVVTEFKEVLNPSPDTDEEVTRRLVSNEVRRRIAVLLLKKGDLVGAFTECVAFVSTTPGRKFLVQLVPK
jgi:tetratricopeptide (TPR) repeat protein